MMEDASVEISEVGGKRNKGDTLGSLIDRYIIGRRRGQKSPGMMMMSLL
jgi:hypothetical protein